jgi:hypothetical protein
MSEFNPTKQIVNSTEILEKDGSLPSFQDSHVISLNYKRGEFSPEFDGFDGPNIEASIEMTYHESPYILDINFYQCSSIVMSYFNYDNVIEKVTFSIEERGFYADDVTPLPPYICVEIGTSKHTVFTSFKCFKIEVIGKRKIIEEVHD